ncbi:MAG: protein kinase [Planctomycetota bacterium]
MRFDAPTIPPAMSDTHASQVEELLAEALALWDAGGDEALDAFVTAHPNHADVLRRGVRRCRDMGLLGRPDGDRGFPDRLGDFRLLRRLGGGGMGVVYEAEQVQLGRRVALKVIRPEFLYFEGARERFRREVDAIAKLSHPAIVPVLAFGEHDAVPYFAMELLPGATAEEVCAAMRGRDPGELSGHDLRAAVSSLGHDATDEAFAGAWWQACTRMALQIALGLRHAHLRGIVHRDVKPSNVMITPHGQAVVLDFGVAQVGQARDLTRSGSAPGSPAFMSPEQIRGDATDERTDVYSLGATLWQLLSLSRPFPERHLHESIQQGHLPALRGSNRSVPRELELVLRTAMDRDRERRYGDIGAFAGDLQAVLQRRPIAARPLGTGLRLLRWCQRHRVAATALAALGVGAAAFPAVIAWQQQRANTILRAEQVRTQQSLDTSLDALHSVLVRLGNEKLRRVPLAEEAAHGALVDAAGLYRQVLQLHPTNTRARVQGGRALHALAMSFERQGKMREAVDTAREAVSVLGGDSRDCPPEQIDVRAHANMSLGSGLADIQATAEALAALDAAERDFLLAGATPAYLAESLRGRAMLRATRSTLLDEDKQADLAESTLREAVELQRKAVAAGKALAKDPALAVTHLTNLAKFLARRERDEEARTEYEEALAAAQSLVRDSSAWPPPDVTVAEIQEGLGNLLGRSDPAAAEDHLHAALATRERVLAQFPNNLGFRVELGGTLHNVGTCAYRSGDVVAALGWFEKARACQETALARVPHHQQSRLYLANHLTMLGRCQAQLGRGDEVVATAAAMTRVGDDARTAVESARLYLRAFGVRQDETSATAGMQQLLLAEQRGLNSSRDLEDEVFAPLHARPEWQGLVERLRQRAPPVAR